MSHANVAGKINLNIVKGAGIGSSVCTFLEILEALGQYHTILPYRLRRPFLSARYVLGIVL